MSSAESLKADATECTRLALLTPRENVRHLLVREAERLEKMASEEELKPRQPSAAPVARSSNVATVKIVNYAWDQSEKFVKLYVTINGVQGLPQGNVISSFQEKVVELTVSQPENKVNHSLAIKNLLYAIKPEESYHKVKSDMVVLFLKKEKSQHWEFVTEAEKKVNERRKPKFNKDEDASDPSAGLMNLMKQMYDEGDDEMKRTIAKAWTEARDKPQPM